MHHERREAVRRPRWILSVALISAIAPVLDARAQLLAPDGFAFEQVVFSPGFGGSPFGFAFLPDERTVFIEKTGAVSIVAAGSTSPTVIGTVPDVNASGFERGLLGVAVDPGWPARPYFYFYYTHDAAVCYLTMYEITGDLADSTSSSLALDSPYHVLTDVPDIGSMHQAGTLRFGPLDGMLYVSVGDDNDACSAQDLTILGGEILRLDVSSLPGMGSGPPPKADITPGDNPFPGPDENERLAYAWGLRNPYRFCIDALTGDLFLGDVGASMFEEIDHVPFAGGGGENFGWPVREGTAPFDCPACDSCGVGNQLTDPIHAYPHPPEALCQAVIGGPLYRPVAGSPTSFPTSYDGSYFFIEWCDGVIRRLVETPQGWEHASPVPGQPSPENWAEGFPSKATDFQEGADGALYVLLGLGGGTGLYRIAPAVPTGVPAPVPGLTVVTFPNPATAEGGANIRWNASRMTSVSVRIVDASGRTVRTLRATAVPATSGAVHWDGRSDAGQPVAAGTYFFTVSDTGGRTSSGRISWLR